MHPRNSSAAALTLSSEARLMVVWRVFHSSLSGEGVVETDSRAAALLAYETNRLKSKGLKERSNNA